MTGKPGKGLSVTTPFSDFMLVTQASPFLPLMFMASEPQMPSRQERRKDRLGSTAFRRMSTSSSMRSPGLTSSFIVCIVGLVSTSGS
ncbi:hypothetical protein D9M68_781550 [compost metagenome]